MALVEGSNQGSVIAVAAIFLVITSIVVGLRVWVRAVVIRQFGMDDYIMMLGTFATFGLSIANIVCAYYGAGVHLEDINMDDAIPLAKSNYSNAICYFAALGLVKTSILIFYLRVDERMLTRYIVYFTMFSVVVLETVSVFLIVFECRPISKYWDRTLPGECMDINARQQFYNANGIINIIQDCIIYLLPFPMIWQLQMPRRQKIGALALMCVGSVAVVAGCVRYYYNGRLSEPDFYYLLADALNWCSIELYFAIIGGSASTFKVLIKRWFPGYWSSDSNRNDPSGGVSNQIVTIGGGIYKETPDEPAAGGNFQMRKTKPTGKVKPGKLGWQDVTIAENESEEAIVTDTNRNMDGQDGGKIVITQDMHTELSDATSEDKMENTDGNRWNKWPR